MATSIATKTYNSPVFIQIVPIILAIWGLWMTFTAARKTDPLTREEANRILLQACLSCLFFIFAGMEDPIFDMLAMLPASVLILAILPLKAIAESFLSLRRTVFKHRNTNAELPRWETNRNTLIVTGITIRTISPKKESQNEVGQQIL